jgi:hypothetical protein
MLFLVMLSPHSNELAMPCVEVNTAKKRIRIDGTPIQPIAITSDGGENGRSCEVGTARVVVEARLQD